MENIPWLTKKVVPKSLLFSAIFLHISYWFMRRDEGGKRNGEIEWAGGKIKMTHKNERETKTTKEEKKAVKNEEIGNQDKNTLLLHFPTAPDLGGGKYI